LGFIIFCSLRFARRFYIFVILYFWNSSFDFCRFIITMTQLPGYAGYHRFFDRESVTHLPIPSHKYQDLQLASNRLTANDPWRSIYSSSMNRDNLAEHWNKETTKIQQYNTQVQQQQPQPPELSKTSIRASSAPVSSASLWSSSYRDSFRKNESRSMNSLYTQPVSLPQVLSSTPFAHNLLRNQPNIQSSYTKEFGKKGESPLQRTGLAVGVPNDKIVTAMSTTKDLFEGTAKDSIRVSGYSGYVPGSINNRHTIQGDNSNHKDNLLQIYRHDMCSYGGHQPRCVINDRGPRSPRGKRRMNEGLVASLILDSMKV